MMMNLEKIKELCAKKESKTLEFKASTSLLRAVFETICAFLNGKGGVVLIGVRDDGRILGQNISDSTRKDISREIKKIEPAALVNVDYVEVEDNLFVIAIHVSAGDHAPYIFDGRAYQRDESETNRMSQHRYEQLIVKRGQLNHSWESFPAEDYNIADLDHDEIYRTVMDGVAEKRIPASIAKESVGKILSQLDLITDEGKLKRAAVVLFAKAIKPDYHQCWIKLARFDGTTKGGDFLDNQQAYCNVFNMLEIADNFLRKHLPMASHFKQDQLKRVDKFLLPTLAFREALVNALCHKDYSDRSGYISIAIFNDRVELWNNGTLPKKIKLTDLKKRHDSILRNELIAKVFYLRGYIEAWGTGILRMMESCKEHGMPPPSFLERTEGLVVTFKFAELIGSVTAPRKKELTQRQQEILRLLSKKPSSSADILSHLEGAPSRRVVQLDLTYLERIGLIKREGLSRARIWHAIERKN